MTTGRTRPIGTEDAVKGASDKSGLRIVVEGTNIRAGAFFEIYLRGRMAVKMQPCMGAAICQPQRTDRLALCGVAYEHQDDTSTLVYI